VEVGPGSVGVRLHLELHQDDLLARELDDGAAAGTLENFHAASL